MRLFRQVLLGVVPLFCADVALAADSAAGQPAIEEIVVSAQSLTAQVDGVGSVTTVDAATLDLLRPNHISEALARVPGTWISRGSGQEHLTAIRSGVLTGAGACGEFLYLEDGVPIRPAGFCNINNLFEINHEQAAAIEVLRGPAGALFGGNALHGVINVVQQSMQPQQAALSVEAGPFDYYQVRAGGAVDLGEHRISARAHSSSSNGYRDATGYSQQKLFLRHAVGVGRWSVNNTLSATLLNQETGGFVRGFEAYKDGALRDSNPNPEAFRDAFSLRAVSAWQTEFDDGAQLRVTPYARRSGMTFLQHFLPGQPLEENDQTSVGAIVTYARSARSDNIERWRASVGGQLEYLEGALKQEQASPTQGSAFLMATRPSGLHYDYEVTSLLGALFYDIGVRLSDSLELVHSARLETLRYDYDNLFIVGNTREDGTTCGFGGCLYTRPPSGKDNFTNVAARLGLNYQFSRKLGGYASISSGFRPPQATELYRLQNGQTLTDLDSEQLRSFEAGVRLESLSVAVYFDATRNLILRDGDGFNISNGKTRSQGIEVAWNTALGAHHEFDIAATYARHKYDFTGAIGREPIVDGNDVDTAPRWLGSARWRYRPSQEIASELEVVGVGQHYIDAANTAEYDGHLLLHWRGSYQLRPNLRIFARVLNILDKQYADRADFAFGGFRYFPGLPRQLYLGIEYNPQPGR